MMGNAFLSEWIRLRRRTLLWGTYGAIGGISVLITVLTFARAGHPGHDRRDFVTLAQLAAPDGLVHGVTRASTLLGVIALCVAAAQVAGEYSNGTLRNLLVRQPRRPVLLVAKLGAVLSFMVGATLVAAVAGSAAAVVMAHVRGIATSGWSSATGLHVFAQGFANTALVVGGYTILGMALGVLLRSPVSSIAVGLAFMLPIEAILSAAVSGLDRWLPGQLLDVVSQGGSSTLSYGAACLRAAVILAIAAGGAMALFVRRDVTS